MLLKKSKIMNIIYYIHSKIFFFYLCSFIDKSKLVINDNINNFKT